MSSVPTTAEGAALSLRLASSRALAHRLALPVVFGLAVAYHGIQSLGHRTPLVFDDELLYSKLSQSIAAGHGLSIWGHHYFFPAPLAPLLWAPVWLLGSAEHAYLAARLINTVAMAAAVFPAYWLARRLVRREWALLTAAAAVALPAMAYHDSLMAEALAYPLFLLGAAVIVHAVADGGRARWLVPVVCFLGMAARLQLVVLPIAYALAVALCSPRRRAHVWPLAVLAVPGLVAFGLRGTGALGQYNGVLHLALTPLGVAHYAALVALLLPFSIGLAVVPGAVLGLVGRPRNRAEGALAVVTAVTLLLLLLQAGMLAAGEAQRPLERYAFYVGPLLVLAFFVYAERGAPRRLAYATLAVAGGLAVAQLPFGELAPPGSLYFDAPSATVFASLTGRLGIPNAQLTIELVALAVGILVAAAGLRRPSLATATALVALVLSFLGGVAYYRADHSTTNWVVDRFAAGKLDWYDRLGLGPATYLSLPAGQLLPDATVEVWNRQIDRVAQMTDNPAGALPIASSRVRDDGMLRIGGRPNSPGIYVLGAFDSRMGVEGGVLARSGWLTAIRLPRGARVRWVMSGVDREGYSQSLLTYRTWPLGPPGRGRFTVSLSLGDRVQPKTVVASVLGGGKQTISLRHGGHVRFTVASPAARVPTLNLSVRVTGDTADSLAKRGVRIERIVYSRD